MLKASDRPKYHKNMPERVRAFFRAPRYDEESRVYFFPTPLGFADEIGTDLRTVLGWAAEHPEFAAALEEGRQRSIELRVAFAQSERINPTFTRFVLDAHLDEPPAPAEKAFEVVLRVVGEDA